MQPNLLMAIILPVFQSCVQVPQPIADQPAVAVLPSENPYATIQQIPAPEGFTRIPVSPLSFGNWLRNFPLKKSTTVYLYNGLPKRNQQAQYVVLDISTGTKDLQQCADAIMRLRAEYLYQQHRYQEIVFKDNNGKPYVCPANAQQEQFNRYLEQVFSYCGTLSLEKQLKPVPTVNTILPGDVFIKGGSPGHAAIVMDVVKNSKGEIRVMLANGYMPAQDIHVVRDPDNDSNSPWINIKDGQWVRLPEWTFQSSQLKTW